MRPTGRTWWVMPKSAAYEIELSGKARAELHREIATRLDMNEEVVGRLRRRFHAERLEGLEARARSGRPRRFPPEQIAEVKAIACELPATHGLPLGRLTRTEPHRLVAERGVTDTSASTIWRWLHDDALKPWQQRSWIFVRDPRFRERAARPSGAGRVRVPPARHAGLPRRLGRPPRQPLRPRRAQDRDRAVRAARRAGHDPRALRLGAHRLLDRRQRLKPRRARLIERLEATWQNLRLVHLPIHASWLNQIELYFSIVQRKALSPNSFDSLDELADRLLRFGEHYPLAAQGCCQRALTIFHPSRVRTRCRYST
jgi:transposase